MQNKNSLPTFISQGSRRFDSRKLRETFFRVVYSSKRTLMKKSRSVPVIDSQSTINGCETSKKWMFTIFYDFFSLELRVTRFSLEFSMFTTKATKCLETCAQSALLVFDEKHFNWKLCSCTLSFWVGWNSQECSAWILIWNNLKTQTKWHESWVDFTRGEIRAKTKTMKVSENRKKREHVLMMPWKLN